MAQIILDSNNNLIQGDFDNATLNNRTKLQTTTTNATTNVYVVPNGSSTSAGVSVANNSNLTNASKIVMATNGTTDTQIISGINGSGTYLPLSFYTNNTFAAQIDTGGRLGINASQPSNYGGAKTVICAGTNPTSGLDTNNQLKIGEATQNFNYCLNVGYINASGTLCGSIQSINNAVATQLLLNPDGGPVIMGTSSPYVTMAVNVQGSGSSGQLALRNSGATAGKFWTLGPNASNNIVCYNNSSVGVFIVDGGTSWAGTSDERVKTDLKPIENAAEKVSTLRSVTGRFKTDDKNKSRAFLIAQDVQKVLPEAVYVQDDEQGTLGLAYTDVIPLLTAAIKEQQAIINELKTRIEALESK